jgi:hypothetical protein
MHIHGKITGIQYKPLLTERLTEIPFDKFDVNSVPTSCVVIDGNYSFAISRWVSPKRTRSYPYERVYNTLNHSKKITVVSVDSKPMICLPVLALTSTILQNMVIRFQHGDTELLDDARFTAEKILSEKRSRIDNSTANGSASQ